MNVSGRKQTGERDQAGAADQLSPAHGIGPVEGASPKVGARPPLVTGAGLLLLIPAALLLLFVFYMPLGTVLLQALKTEPVNELREMASAYSFSRFTELISDAYIVGLIGFTIRQAFWSTLLSVAIGVPLAYVLANRSFRGKSALASLMMVPFVMPAVTVALGFLLMFGVNGWFNELFDLLFGTKVRVLHSMWAIVLAHAFFNAPVVARMTQGAWERLDPALEESARTLGASPWAVWWHVTVPAVMPGLISGALLAFVYCFMSFPIVLALGGARFSTLEVEIYTMIRVLLDYETGAALAGLQALISLSFAYVMLRVEGIRSHSFASVRNRPTSPLFRWGSRRRASAAKGDDSAVPSPTNRGWIRKFGGPRGADVVLWVFLATVALLFVGPLASIVVDSLRDSQGNISLLAYKRVLAPGYDIHLGGPPVRAIQNSVRFGFMAATIALAAGATFVYGTVRFVRRRLPFVETVTLAPVAVSSVALAYGLLLAFRQPPLSLLSDEWRIPLIHSVLAFPFVVRAFRPVLQGVDTALVEAAQTLGAGRWRAFVDVELPLALTGLLVAFALSFGLSVSETSAALMLSRPDQVTMPVSVYRFLASRDFTGAAAMAIVLMTVTGGVFLLAEIVGKWIGQRGTGRGGTGTGRAWFGGN